MSEKDIGTNFMIFENLDELLEQHKKEKHPYKTYEFDSVNYTLLLCDINKLKKQNELLMKRDNKCQLLEQVIDKAIKYIENGLENITYEYKDNCDYINIDFYELLDILKEVK